MEHVKSVLQQEILDERNIKADSKYPAVEETESTSSITEPVETKVLRVTCQMLAFPSMFL